MTVGFQTYSIYLNRFPSIVAIGFIKHSQGPTDYEDYADITVAFDENIGRKCNSVHILIHLVIKQRPVI